MGADHREVKKLWESNGVCVCERERERESQREREDYRDNSFGLFVNFRLSQKKKKEKKRQKKSKFKSNFAVHS